ncbi:MAG: TolC family protein [Bacteroidales bacterium]|nr:TolC family protein [Bacteroidales bacterium]
MNRYIAHCVVLVCLICSACSGVRHLTKPQGNVPDKFTHNLDNDSACMAELDWWKFYSDSTLCGFISHTLEHNRDLLSAASRIQQAKELYGVDKANLFPQINGSVYANDETNDYSGTGIKHDREMGVKFPITWEMNLLGSAIWASKRGKAGFLASIEDYRAMQVLLIAETAKAYYRLVALENELSIIRRTVETRKESLRMAKIRFEGGLTSETVYQQAMVEYATAASLVPNLRQKITTARNALTLLMGELPNDTLTSGVNSLDPIQLEKLPVGVPSQLLERRPDIRGAQQRLSAAKSNVGYTYAERFPSLQLGFTPGFENNELAKFLQSPFTFIVGSVAGAVFDFGRRKHKYKAAIAEYDQARFKYEKTVIQAFTEVNTAINAYKAARRSSKLKIELCQAALKYNKLAELQYRGGSLNYIDVLDAQRKYFDAQIDESNAIIDEYIALIDLYKVLGGGWNLN